MNKWTVGFLSLLLVVGWLFAAVQSVRLSRHDRESSTRLQEAERSRLSADQRTIAAETARDEARSELAKEVGDHAATRAALDTERTDHAAADANLLAARHTIACVDQTTSIGDRTKESLERLKANPTDPRVLAVMQEFESIQARQTAGTLSMSAYAELLVDHADKINALAATLPEPTAKPHGVGEWTEFDLDWKNRVQCADDDLRGKWCTERWGASKNSCTSSFGPPGIMTSNMRAYLKEARIRHSWTKADGDRIIGGDTWVGMTAEQLYWSQGPPDRVRNLDTPGTERQFWNYGRDSDHLFSKREFTLEDRHVTTWIFR
jgi:hypothetical protein